tara:strand:- start:73 stop:1083 length:1011 start_codon:yes stop_codon:yes gene_type:complete
MILSIIIPVYNGEEFIGNCLKSLLNQGLHLTQYEIIVIDDGSSDNSRSIVLDFIKQNSNIQIYSQENKGLSASRNIGMEMAKGKYLYFLDADDYLAANVLDELIKYLETYNLDLLNFMSCKTTRLDMRDSQNRQSFSSKLEILDGISYIAKNNYQFEVWRYIVKRKFLFDLKIKFLEGRLMEDAYFTTRLFINAERMAMLPLDAHRYVQLPGSIMNRVNESHTKKMLRDFEFNAIKFGEILKSIPEEAMESKRRIRAHQESFVFFMIFKHLKSSLKFAELRKILNRLKQHNLYPMRNFIGKDYSDPNYKKFTFIFNNKYLLFFFFKSYRFLKELKK